MAGVPVESAHADYVGEESPAADGSFLKDIGSLAVWSLSGAKPGNGIDQLLDDDTATYWQSDGVAPHLINVQFPRKVSLSQVSLYLDFNLDESYTPKRVCVRAGSTAHDLRDIAVFNLHEPVGWINVPLGDPSALGGNRDTHIRQAKVFGPPPDGPAAASHPLSLPPFADPALTLYATVR